MTPQELKEVLLRTNLDPADIKAETRIAVTTVYRFLRGENINDSTLHTLEQWARSKGFVPAAKRA
jgi:predicted transcriptional regulator